eukprot:TRINITY_DN105729_c0_g1_i1.p4 TRINITY_DN105729_c0_g1~~TRINITY_DN105729_c0_g1_i1.p4  ORF type:complete len:109 (+),score=6.66 TRINITY_DN105729_c0_g1_i1:205-531(+)
MARSTGATHSLRGESDWLRGESDWAPRLRRSRQIRAKHASGNPCKIAVRQNRKKIKQKKYKKIKIKMQENVGTCVWIKTNLNTYSNFQKKKKKKKKNNKKKEVGRAHV